MFEPATIRYECGMSEAIKCSECGKDWDGQFETSDGEKICSECQQKFFSFEYRMLSRLQQDCEYFLGYGNRCEKHLWADTAKEHIEEMKKLYKLLPVEPEWISMDDIEKYEKEMLKTV